jgi:hypothetical protein
VDFGVSVTLFGGSIETFSDPPSIGISTPRSLADRKSVV